MVEESDILSHSVPVPDTQDLMPAATGTILDWWLIFLLNFRFVTFAHQRLVESRDAWPSDTIWAFYSDFSNPPLNPGSLAANPSVLGPGWLAQEPPVRHTDVLHNTTSRLAINHSFLISQTWFPLVENSLIAIKLHSSQSLPTKLWLPSFLSTSLSYVIPSQEQMLRTPFLHNWLGCIDFVLRWSCLGRHQS